MYTRGINNGIICGFNRPCKEHMVNGIIIYVVDFNILSHFLRISLYSITVGVLRCLKIKK